MKIATNSAFYERTTYIEIDYYFTEHHHSKTKIITLPYIPSWLQIADFFIKTHTSKRHQLFTFQTLRDRPTLSLKEGITIQFYIIVGIGL